MDWTTSSGTWVRECYGSLGLGQPVPDPPPRSEYIFCEIFKKIKLDNERIIATCKRTFHKHGLEISLKINENIQRDIEA